MNLDQFETHLEKSSREIFKSLGVIQELLNSIKLDEKKKSETIEKSETIDKSETIENLERTKYQMQRDIYPESIVYEKTPTKKKKKKKKSKFSYSTFVVDTSSSSEDEGW